MNKYVKYCFLSVVFAASLVVLFAAGVFAYMKVQEAMITRVNDPDINLKTVNHWLSGDKLVFTAIAENNSEHEWLNVSVNFIVKKSDGSFFKRCPLLLINKPFSSGNIDIEAVCTNMPAGFSNYTYEVKIF
ncbi:hypothetical protein, partial [Oleiphilus sp. HI0061]